MLDKRLDLLHASIKGTTLHQGDLYGDCGDRGGFTKQIPTATIIELGCGEGLRLGLLAVPPLGTQTLQFWGHLPRFSTYFTDTGLLIVIYKLA